MVWSQKLEPLPWHIHWTYTTTSYRVLLAKINTISLLFSFSHGHELPAFCVNSVEYKLLNVCITKKVDKTTYWYRGSLPCFVFLFFCWDNVFIDLIVTFLVDWIVQVFIVLNTMIPVSGRQQKGEQLKRGSNLYNNKNLSEVSCTDRSKGQKSFSANTAQEYTVITLPFPWKKKFFNSAFLCPSNRHKYNHQSEKVFPHVMRGFRFNEAIKANYCPLHRQHDSLRVSSYLISL